MLNVKNECEVCGKKVPPGEKYCEKHKNVDVMDRADIEEIEEEDTGKDDENDKVDDRNDGDGTL